MGAASSGDSRYRSAAGRRQRRIGLLTINRVAFVSVDCRTHQRNVSMLFVRHNNTFGTSLGSPRLFFAGCEARRLRVAEEYILSATNVGAIAIGRSAAA